MLLTNKKFSLKVSSVTLQEMSEEEQEFLEGLATVAKSYLAEGQIDKACQYLAGQNLDVDECVAIWAFFDSKQRRAMKG
jgi:hypothetical protein